MSIQASLEETFKSLDPNRLKRFSLTHFWANVEESRADSRRTIENRFSFQLSSLINEQLTPGLIKLLLINL